jgi:hypothetical protein
VVIDKGVSGLNNEIMEDWVDEFLKQENLNPKEDILCFDNDI